MAIGFSVIAVLALLVVCLCLALGPRAPERRPGFVPWLRSVEWQRIRRTRQALAVWVGRMRPAGFIPRAVSRDERWARRFPRLSRLALA